MSALRRGLGPGAGRALAAGARQPRTPPPWSPGVAKLEDLEADGPGADLWWPLADLDDGPVPWWELTGTKP